MNNNALEIHSLKKTFTDFGLDDISFSLPTGFIMGLVGKNGAGKTTTIKLILNLLQKESGLIKVFGNDISNRYDFKQDIAVVFDDLLFVEDWKIDDVEKAISPFYDKWNTAKFQSNIERFHLNRNKKIRDFSKGMKVKLAFAVALSHKAELLILDEATSGLDPIIRDDILDILIDFVQDENYSILFSSHITSDLEKIADYITFIHKGRLVFCSLKDDLIDNYGVVSCGASVFDTLDKTEIISYQKEDYQYKVLVRDRNKIAKDFPKALVEPATIENIMLFYVKGELQ